MRYTEVRTSKFAHLLLKDLEKETVDFQPNYDETEFAPTVLPSRVPNLLLNGSSGIAVGMATNIPPHNLREVISACLALIDNPEITIDALMEYVKGPDFPTAGIINGRAGIIEGYKTGRGRIQVRARTEIEVDKSGKQTIVVTELPYQVNKARLIEKIAELVKDQKIEGISALRDESDKDGMRMVIELKRNEVAEVILNNLYAHTQMQTVFGINMVALEDGQPKTMNLKQMLEVFIRHRRVVVNRRTVYELRKARERAHILEGWGVALANIDEVITLIKTAPTPQDAKEKLQKALWKPGSAVLSLLQKTLNQTDNSSSSEKIQPDPIIHNQYQLSAIQAQAILDLRLHRLTGLEQDKILEEYENILIEIKKLLDILNNPDVLMNVIRAELDEVLQEFADDRRTEILFDSQDLCNEDLITEEDMVVTLSYEGYVKAQPITAYASQKRGGRGKAAISIKDEDYITRLLIASTHDTILCFSSLGKVYWLKVYALPLGSRTARGKPIVNLLPLEAGEQINAMLPLREYTQGAYVFMATSNGTVKKVDIKEFSRPRTSGIRAIDLVENDVLVGAEITDGTKDIMLFTNTGKAIRFKEEKTRVMGRAAKGIRGIRLQEEGQAVIALLIADEKEDYTVLTATENGYGKRTLVSEYPTKGRGGQGVIAIQTSDRNGQVVGAVKVGPHDQIMLISDGGTLVRTAIEGISVVGRNTQGVKLINLSNGEKLVGLQRVQEIEASEASTMEEDALE